MRRRALRAPPGPCSGRCRSARSGRRRAGGRCAPRIRPSPPVRPCLPPEDRCGTRLRAAARSRPRAPASGRASALPRSTPPSPGCGRRRRPRESPSASFSSSISIVASPLPPTLTNATSGPIATIVPSMVWPFSKRFAWSDASNIAAKSSSGSLTARSCRITIVAGDGTIQLRYVVRTNLGSRKLRPPRPFCLRPRISRRRAAGAAAGRSHSRPWLRRRGAVEKTGRSRVRGRWPWIRALRRLRPPGSWGWTPT